LSRLAIAPSIRPRTYLYFFCNRTAPTEISTLSLHDALPILVRAGMERSRHWGWPNTYCYTKSLGDQVIDLVSRETGLEFAIVRPAIVESALAFPFPGWNEGFTTTAPLTFLAMRGHRSFAARKGLVLDVVPVDLIAAG